MSRHDKIDANSRAVRLGYLNGDRNPKSWIDPKIYVVLLAAYPQNLRYWTPEQKFSMEEIFMEYRDTSSNKN